MPEAVAIPTDHEHCYHTYKIVQMDATIHESGVCCHCGQEMHRSYPASGVQTFTPKTHGPFWKLEARL